MQSADRLHPMLAARLSSTRTTQPMRLIVQYEPSMVGPTVAAMRWSAHYVGRILPFMAVTLPAGQIGTLAEEPYVVRVWEDLPVKAMLDVSVPKIGAPQVWDLGWTGEGVRVAVVDTGVDFEHPDLKDAIVASADFSGKGEASDGSGHGTHVASIIAGSGAASGGKYRGVAPGAELYIAKVLDDRGEGLTSDVLAGLDWAAEQQVHVINLSLGADVACDGSDALSTACDRLVDMGIVVCVAAGNAGPGAGTVGTPGCARKVITVGATTDNDLVALFSSRGPTRDGRVKPDICFPGEGIIAARARGTSTGTPQDEYYTAASGTSMATPHCSGAVALLLEAEPHLTPKEVKARLMETAHDLGVDKNAQGSGRGNVFAAVTAPTPQPEPEPTPPLPPPEPPATPEPPGPPESPPEPPDEPPGGPPTEPPAPPRPGCMPKLLVSLIRLLLGLT